MRGFVVALVVGIVSWAVIPDARAKDTCVPSSQCCKVCDAGQACGNSCISRSKQCHKGRGCACNLREVCGSDD